MAELKKIADAYIAAWNAVDPAERATRIAAAFTETASYRDPLMAGDGHDGIAALIAGVQERFPGFRFTLKGEPDGFAEMIRFSWSLGPDGEEAPVEETDICVIEDGRLARVTGFLDKVPAQQA